MMIVSGNPDIKRDTELRELVNAVSLFVENYRKIHTRTFYAPQVDAAATRLLEKLREL